MIKILQILAVKRLDDSNTVKLKPMFNYNNVYRAKDYDDANLQVLTRVGGAAQSVGGVAATAFGVGICETGMGCVGGVPIAAYGVDNAVAGARTIYSGKYHSTIGATALADLTGINPETAELIYSSPSMAFGVKPIAMGAAKATGAVANEVARIGGDVKYVAGELGKDVKAGYHSIPNSYKVVFGIEASINATAESIPYFTGKKESSLDNLGGSASKVLVDFTHAVIFSKSNAVVGFSADFIKNLSEGNSVKDAAISSAVSSVAGKGAATVTQNESLQRVISSGSSKVYEYQKENLKEKK